MELTPEQRKIIDLVNQLPDDIKENTLEIMSQMRVSAETTKKDLKNVMMSSDVTKEEKEMLEKYNATKKVIDEFHQFCLKLSEKETPNFWDRSALSIESVSQLAIPLLKIWGKQVWFAEKGDTIINDLKSELVKTYTTRFFLGDILESKTLDDFKDSLNKKIPANIENFNKSVAGSAAEIDINKIDANSSQIPLTRFNEILVTAFEKIEKFKENQEFLDKMWDNFVKDFLQKAPNIKTDEDKAWFFEQLFNIAYHSADYIDRMKHDRNIIYCFNYQLLHNNFDIEKTDHYDFQVNHIDKSTTYSNLVYKWAEQLGIKKLKILVGKYLIKP